MAYPQEIKDKAIELYAVPGATVKSVADALGVSSFSTVANWIREAEEPSRAIELPAETKTLVTERLVESVERFKGITELEWLYGESKKLIGEAAAPLDNARIIAIAEKIAIGIVKVQGQCASPVEVKEHHEFDSKDYRDLADENPS